MDNSREQEHLGCVAYKTHVWHAVVAVRRQLALSKHLLAGEKYPDLYEDGPCSRAEIVKDEWFHVQ